MPRPDRNQPEASEVLKGAGLQVTAQRLAVFRAVQSSPHAMADEICDNVRGGGKAQETAWRQTSEPNSVGSRGM